MHPARRSAGWMQTRFFVMKKKLLSLILTGLGILVLPNAALGAEPKTIGELVTKISNALYSAMSGIVLIAWIVIAFLYLTAWGSPEKLKTAHHAVIWAAVGTAILVLYKSIEPIIKNALGV
ncbi:MAG: hypothetical protein CEN87_387 [Parcubacteria group bacterium Licking1014_1]|nr:MAG: hypothetical protein CEN87_387 [Parcubacteria group bacterium Licking1014_1]